MPLYKQKEIVKTKTFVWGCILVGISLLIKIISLFPFFVEHYYSEGFYLYVSSFFRILFGWLPFSFGDVLYFAGGVFLFLLLLKMIMRIYQRRVGKIRFANITRNVFFTLLGIYIFFNLAWGLNYNRPGIASQLGLLPTMHNEKDLKFITQLLLEKTNSSRHAVSAGSVKYKPYRQVFDEAQRSYDAAAVNFPFIAYKKPSVKKSMYGSLGNFLGFLGYYNPFTGEAQLNLTMPRFLIPYVTCHEMAHQLGYASESEANFVGYLAAVASKDSLFKYSVYYDLFNYANRELYLRDSAAAKNNYRQLDTLVKADVAEVREYWRKSENDIEPVIKFFYDHFLKANQQHSGMRSYNEVIGWLIAYYKKYGQI